jgi:hypothetical protein
MLINIKLLLFHSNAVRIFLVFFCVILIGHFENLSNKQNVMMIILIIVFFVNLLFLLFHSAIFIKNLFYNKINKIKFFDILISFLIIFFSTNMLYLFYLFYAYFFDPCNSFYNKNHVCFQRSSLLGELHIVNDVSIGVDKDFSLRQTKWVYPDGRSGSLNECGRQNVRKLYGKQYLVIVNCN